MTQALRDIARPVSFVELQARFRWDIPEFFNFGTDVVDHYATASDGPALSWCDEAGDERHYTFSQISRLSNQLANVMRGQGIEKGDRVIVMLPRRPEWMIAITALMKIGAVPIPSIEMLTARDIEYRVTNSGARGALCRAEHVAKFDAVRRSLCATVCIGTAPGWVSWDDAMAAASGELAPATVRAEDPAIMYYTSGSTGYPKGVIHASRAIYAWRVTALYWLDLRPGDTIWCTADTGWAKAGTSVIFGPWSCGAATFFYDGGFDAKRRLELLASQKITVYCAPSTELSRLVDQRVADYDLSKLRRVVTAGEALNPATARRFESAVGVRIDESYGQTECLMVTVNMPGEPVHYGSMGRPGPGCDLDIIDAQGHRLPAGEEGDVALMTPNPQIMLEYWRDPERTQSVHLTCDEGTWLLTGDRGVKDENGYFWFAGRSDDVINSAGYRIGPLEVENALLEHEAVLTCAVVGSPDTERGELVKAFIILRDGFTPDERLTKTLQDHVKSFTAPYKYPRAIEYVRELPLTATGKIKRRTLRDQEYEKAGRT